MGLESELDAETRRFGDISKNLRKSERSIKELTFAADEDKKNHERMQSLIDQLQLVNERLHPFVVLLVLISCKCELLDRSLRLAEILAYITKASGLGIKLRLQFTNTSLHLNHGFPASLEGIDLSFISTGSGILALSLKNLLILLKIHSQVPH